MEFSLFYFADDSGGGPADGSYRLLLEGARFADTHGFTAVWTPERHFHAFGGQYPNPAVTGAAVAAVTERVGIRAGSVVAPLHHAVRIAEEWSVVDRLSGGRAGVSFASGWHSNDFVLRPDKYRDRKQELLDTMDTVRRLWRQESVDLPGTTGAPVTVRTFPQPVQPELPVWLTSAGNPETFREAGRLGVGVLTHLLGQEPAVLRANIAAYRAEFAAAHGGTGHVALMLHTFMGTDREQVRSIVREPFTAYLRSSFGLIARAAGELIPGLKLEDLSPADIEFIVERSFDRYFDTGGLFGTQQDGLETLEALHGTGVDEVACLIDFVPDTDLVLDGLVRLDQLKNAWQVREAAASELHIAAI